MSYTLGDVFEAHGYDYGFNPNENFATLLDIAGAFNADFTSCISEELQFDDKAGNNLFNVTSVLEQIQSKEARNAVILHELQFDDFTDAHAFLVKSTQQLFFNRAGERWDTKIPVWIENNLSQVTKILKNLNSCKEILPSQNEYDCLAVHGATTAEMNKRLTFAYKLLAEDIIEVNHGLFLLTGERYANEKIDSAFIIEAAAEHFEVSVDEVTEAHMMEKIHLDYVQSDDSYNFSYYVVDAPNGGKSRPSTVDTIELFINDFGHQCGSILFISRNPNIYAQAEASHTIIKSMDRDISYETVGGACEYNEAPPLHAAYHTIMPVAGAWFGAWYRVEREVKGKVGEFNNAIRYTPTCATGMKNQTLGLY